jgi:hypothetical protein
MALHLNLDRNDRVYFALTCDECAARFACYDDACYSFPSLRTEAILAGWDVGIRPENAAHCASCVRRTLARTEQPPAVQRTTVQQ